MILIVGCGHLGSYLEKALAGTSSEPVLGAVRDPGRLTANRTVCDVTNEADLRRLSSLCGDAPLTVFYFAASHNIDAVFRDPQAAGRVNIDGLSLFLKTMPRIGRLFYSSTDCVYGENTPAVPAFNEASPLCPVNVYGAQKAEAEKIVLAHGFTVLRFGYMLGPSLTGRPHFYDRIRGSLSRGESVEMIDGLKRSVLSYRSAGELLASLSRLPRAAVPSVLNVCSDARLTKAEMGRRIAAAAGAPQTLIRAIPESEGKRFFEDARASSAVMDNALLKRILGLREIPWEEGESI